MSQMRDAVPPMIGGGYVRNTHQRRGWKDMMASVGTMCAARKKEQESQRQGDDTATNVVVDPSKTGDDKAAPPSAYVPKPHIDPGNLSGWDGVVDAAQAPA